MIANSNLTNAFKQKPEEVLTSFSDSTSSAREQWKGFFIAKISQSVTPNVQMSLSIVNV